MYIDKDFDLEQSKIIIEDYKKMNRNFLFPFISKGFEMLIIKKTPLDYLISELNYRNSNNTEYIQINIENIKILKTEILYRRKEKINKIKRNIK